MTSATQRLLTCLFALIPALASADTCNTIVNLINNDINKYADTLKDQRLVWMELSWLQHQLGSTATTQLTDDKNAYKWTCANGGEYVEAQTDKAGNIENISGEYNSSNGSGIFSSPVPDNKTEHALKQAVADIKSTPTPVLAVEEPEQQNESDETDTHCRQLINQIHNDITNNPDTFEQRHFSWLKTAWLQNALGQVSGTANNDYVYIWDKFRMFIGADGHIATLGSLPANTASPTNINDATRLFGHPKKNLSEKLTQYTWQCPMENSSSLTIQSDTDGLVLSLSGNDCLEDNCIKFSAPLYGSKIKAQFENQIKLQAKTEAIALAARLRDYNEFYKTQFQRYDEISTDIKVKIKNFYTSLRQCTPGIYNYPIPVSERFLFNSTVIEKANNNHCSVKTTYDIPEIGKVVLKCNYQQKSLGLFTDSEAESAAAGNLSYNSENPSDIQKAMDNECQRYINGVL